MATAKDTVQGLDRLLQLGVVHLHQKNTRFTGNKYMVNTAEGENLFTMKEQGGALSFLSRGHIRGFEMNAVDAQGRNAFSLRRPSVFMSDKVELSMNGQLIITVRKEATFMKPVFHINDANEVPTLRIKGETNVYDFKLQTADKTTIGSICKQYRGLKEMFTYADDYVITFPANLDVRYKAAVIGTCIFIDYVYHES